MRDAGGRVGHSRVRRRRDPRSRTPRPAERSGSTCGVRHRRALRRGAPHRDGTRGACARDRELRVGRHRTPARGDLRRGGGVKRWRYLLVIPLLALAVSLVIWRGPDWRLVHDAFTAVSWKWVAAAIGLNLLSVLARACSWDTAIKQSIAPPHPSFPTVFSAFSVGLFANAVLPGRVGELARVVVLRRRLPNRRGTTATLIGSVFAHRMFDVPPAATLVVFVLVTAKLPGWALGSIGAALGIGVLLMLFALWLARRQHRELNELGRI